MYNDTSYIYVSTSDRETRNKYNKLHFLHKIRRMRIHASRTRTIRCLLM